MPRLPLAVLLALAACSRTGSGADAGPSPDDDAGHDLTSLVVRGDVKLRPTGDTTGIEVVARCGDTVQSTTSADDGSYELTVDVEGCQPLVIEFRKPTYLPVLRRIPLPPPTSPVDLDATLAALRELQCDDEACVEEGRRFNEFPPGPMRQGWVTALTGPEAAEFAGGRLRSDSGALLWLTAFGYFDLRDANGNPMDSFAPFNQCFEVDRDALDWLVDELPDNGSIDMSTFRLDEARAIWRHRTARARVGYTEEIVDGHKIIALATEEDLASIRSDQFEKSSDIWLCTDIDGSGWIGFGSAIEEKACLSPRVENSCGLVLDDTGIDLVGRDHGFRDMTWTDRDGRACLEVARSEPAGSDFDHDNLGGEDFFSNIEARWVRGTERIVDQLHPGDAGNCGEPSSCTPLVITFDTVSDGCNE